MFSTFKISKIVYSEMLLNVIRPTIKSHDHHEGIIWKLGDTLKFKILIESTKEKS